jgi:hypothetical protein
MKPQSGICGAVVFIRAYYNYALILNGQMSLEYQKQLSTYREREEKAAGDILAHLSRSQQTHVKDKGSDARASGTR